MINHKEKYKVTVEDILTFLNYKKEINANRIRFNGPMATRQILERMQLVLSIYQDICDAVNNPEILNCFSDTPRYLPAHTRSCG